MLLVRALEEKDVALARELLRRGCPVDRARPGDGMTPLLAAAKSGLLAELETLLAVRAAAASRHHPHAAPRLQIARAHAPAARPRC